MSADAVDVTEDSRLSPEEKQLSFTTTKRDDHVHVHSEVASVTRWLIEHPAVEVTDLREREGSVVACSAQFPIGLMKLSAKPRQSDQFSGIVSYGQLRGRE